MKLHNFLSQGTVRQHMHNHPRLNMGRPSKVWGLQEVEEESTRVNNHKSLHICIHEYFIYF